MDSPWLNESRELAKKAASSSTTSEPVQPININMSAVEPALIGATGSTTSSSGSSQSSTAPLQSTTRLISSQSSSGSSEAAAEHLVEADGAVTSSSGSSHPSTSSAQQMYPSSIAVLLPERKRSRTDDSVHAEGSGSQSDLSISNNPTNAVNDMTAVTSVTQSATVAVGQRRFPASAMRPRVNPRDADLSLRPGMFKSDSEFYLACSRSSSGEPPPRGGRPSAVLG